MNNVNLNAGGLLGALIFGGGAAAYCAAHWGAENIESWGAKMFVCAIVVGALAGNMVWALSFKK